MAANHLRLRAEGGAAHFECRGNALVALAGKDRRSGRLSPGEEIDIGGNRLRVIDAPPGFQLALELSVDAEQELSSRVRLASELGAAVPQEDAKTRVSRDRDSKRRSAIDQLYWELALLEQEEKTAQTRRRPFRPS